MGRSAQPISDQSRLATEPISQDRISAVVTGSGDRLKTSAVSAPPKADRATPNRISVSGSRNLAAATATMAPAARAPARADSSTAPGTAATPSAMAPAAPSPPPAETPSTPGSARGLRSRPCITAPARPRAAPTTAAAMARGARRPHRISPGAEAGWRKASAYWPSVRLVSPRPTPAAISAARTRTSRVKSARAVIAAAPRPPTVPPRPRRTRPGSR